MDDRATAIGLVSLSRETLARLDAYVDLLRRWQARTNLVAASTLPELWTRHVADSLQLLHLAPAARCWIDIGSGGGFPGIVLACAIADMPHARVHLVERNAKKAAFLREALRVTGAAGFVHLGDIADCADGIPADIDVVTARAVAPLSDLIAMADCWLRRGSKALFYKGRDLARELDQSPIPARYVTHIHESVIGDGYVVELAEAASPAGTEHRG